MFYLLFLNNPSYGKVAMENTEPAKQQHYKNEPLGKKYIIFNTFTITFA